MVSFDSLKGALFFLADLGAGDDMFGAGITRGCIGIGGGIMGGGIMGGGIIGGGILDGRDTAGILGIAGGLVGVGAGAACRIGSRSAGGSAACAFIERAAVRV